MKNKSDLVITTKKLCPQCRNIQELDADRCSGCHLKFAIAARGPVTFNSLCVAIALACSVAAGLVVAGARLTSVL